MSDFYTARVRDRCAGQVSGTTAVPPLADDLLLPHAMGQTAACVPFPTLRRW